jgi:transposase InsO family protein
MGRDHYRPNQTLIGRRLVLGKSQEEYAELVGATARQVRNWASPLVPATPDPPLGSTATRSCRRGQPGDLLKRDFTAPAPNTRWVVDFMYVPRGGATVYAALINTHRLQ